MLDIPQKMMSYAVARSFKLLLQVAKLYGVPVILHTDHCQKAWLPWFDGLIEASEEYFEKYGEPLFSSHMLDLSEERLSYMNGPKTVKSKLEAIRRNHD